MLVAGAVAAAGMLVAADTTSAAAVRACVRGGSQGRGEGSEIEAGSGRPSRHVKCCGGELIDRSKLENFRGWLVGAVRVAIWAEQG